MREFQVPTYDQRLTLEQTELMDNEKTLADLNILPGSSILLRVSALVFILNLSCSLSPLFFFLRLFLALPCFSSAPFCPPVSSSFSLRLHLVYPVTSASTTYHSTPMYYRASESALGHLVIQLAYVLIYLTQLPLISFVHFPRVRDLAPRDYR